MLDQAIEDKSADDLVFGTAPPEPYARLILDALRGDPMLFARGDEIEEQWRIVDPVLKAATPVHEYEPGTWGPKEASELLERDGRHWRSIEE